MSTPKPRILIVDDERSNLQILNAILQDDYDISVALNGQQALKRALGPKKPDLILLDIQMPDMSGFEVCRRIMDGPETQDIPVIFITGLADEKDEQQGFDIGAVDYITKPFGTAVVMARIRAHLELKRKRDILKNLSTMDGLTQIANRRRLEERFGFEWQRCVRSGESIALIMADIDHFKLYNDHYGHTAGDACLREVARTMADMATRQTDLVARYGGEEFACVLPGTNLVGAFAVAEKMRGAVEDLGIPHAFSPTARSITLSLGVAVAYPKRDHHSKGDLFQEADLALYAAKTGGRNRVTGGGDSPGKIRRGKSPARSLRASTGAVAAKPRILIADDEPIDVNLLQAILGDSYTTIRAANGNGALALARMEPRPDIILLGLRFSDQDGHTVCDALKADARTRDIPVLFITVADKEADGSQGLKSGAADYITKPFDPALVLARVETHLRLKRTLADLKRRNKILEEALNLRDSLDRIVSSDFKKPLKRIFAIAARLSEAAEIPPGRIQDIAAIEQSGYALLEMIAASIDLWKLERGVYHIDRQPVDLVEIVRAVGRALANQCVSAGMAILIRVAGRAVAQGDRFEVLGEDLLCYSMLFNLLKNAVQASPQNIAVTVDLEETPQTRRVRITNRGVIPMELRSTFMEKGLSLRKKSAGGVGPYAAGRMALAMGAVIRLDVDDDDDTTCITIDFPHDQALRNL